GSVELDFGEFLRCPAACENAFGLFHGGFEQTLLDTVEGLPLFYKLTLFEQDRVQISSDTRAHLDTLDGFDAADKVFALSNRLRLGYGGCHRNGQRRKLLRK